MEPASERFFDVPELVFHLANYLDSKGLSRLMRTCRRMHSLCTPAHYYDVAAGYVPGENNILGSPESVMALSRNVHHVRQIDIWRPDIVYYANCIAAYQNLLVPQAPIMTTGRRKGEKQQQQQQQQQQQPPSRQQQRPPWLAPPDPHICTVFPIPPMTLLTRLIFYFPVDDDYSNCPYYLPSYRDPKAVITQACWIIDFNPHLIQVALQGVAIKDQRDVRLLTTSISGLKSLKYLTIDAYWPEETTPSLSFGSVIFFSCPPSLQKLNLESREETSIMDNLFTDEYRRLAPGRLLSWEKDDEECGLLLTPRRQEPLPHLMSLWMGQLDEGDISEQDLRLMLEHSPNLIGLNMPTMLQIRKVRHLAKEIAQFCPNLCNLGHRIRSNQTTLELILRIADALPCQQFETLQCYGIEEFAVLDFDGAGLFRKHSRTLRSMALGGCLNFDSKAVQVILCECAALEELYAERLPNDTRHHICINLDDAIEFPWACVRLGLLGLAIAIPDQPLHRFADDVVPHYNRPTPTALTAAEAQQFRSLEALYRQLGKLTELSRLDLQAVFVDSKGQRPTTRDFRATCFPGLFSLGIEGMGGTGYLQHLGGLTKLQQLEGSVSAKTAEMQTTIGMLEVVWMERHWPALERAHFFASKGDLMSDPFRWWLLESRHKKRKLAFF